MASRSADFKSAASASFATCPSATNSSTFEMEISPVLRNARSSNILELARMKNSRSTIPAAVYRFLSFYWLPSLAFLILPIYEISRAFTEHNYVQKAVVRTRPDPERSVRALLRTRGLFDDFRRS